MGWQSLPDGALGNPFGYHSRVGGNVLLNHWIPAFAGMTKGLKSEICQKWQRGCQDNDKPISVPVVMPAKARLRACRRTPMQALKMTASGQSRRSQPQGEATR